MGDISLMYLLQLAWRRIWALLLAMVLFAAGAFCYCKFLATPKYTASSSILVTNGAIVTQYNTEENSEGDAISGTDISASLSLANTVIDILKTPDIYVILSEELNNKYAYDQLQGIITVARRDTNTLFIDITVRLSDPDEAKSLANKFAAVSCNYVTEYIPYAKARVASSAMKNTMVFPKTTTTTVAAALLGIVVAFAIVFISDSLNQSIRGEDDFVSRYKIPLLGSIPDFQNNEVTGNYYSKKIRYGGKKKYTGLSEENMDNKTEETNADKPVKPAPFAVVEAYKSIRSNLMFLLEKGENGNVIAVTSSNSGEGKSTTVVNLAVAFSQLEDKILVIDGDMRRSSVHKKLKLQNETGLSNFLAGFVDFDSAINKISENFHVMTAGQTPPNPSEMLSSKRFAELIKHAREIYDYVIIDTPPINVVSDAVMLAPHTDGVVFVLRDGYTPNYTVKRGISILEFTESKILGAIMNGANPKSGSKYIYRKYSYRSRYYNQYYKYGYSSHYDSYKGHTNKNSQNRPESKK